MTEEASKGFLVLNELCFKFQDPLRREKGSFSIIKLADDLGETKEALLHLTRKMKEANEDRSSHDTKEEVVSCLPRTLVVEVLVVVGLRPRELHCLRKCNHLVVQIWELALEEFKPLLKKSQSNGMQDVHSECLRGKDRGQFFHEN